jgi:16S rRNA (cytidine1402-2'-O)-methyltransferase
VARLYVVATPIGNLEDITLRALRVLRDVQLVLAEDTRRSRQLLRHFDISTRLLSYHQHNKRSRLPEIMRALGEGDVALVSNAGMPAISDPGFELIRAAIEAGIDIDVIPGPSAVITALVAAALPAPGFVFLGFLPRTRKDRRACIADVAAMPYTLVLYEAPHRLPALLGDLLDGLGDRAVVIARELTKLHQEIIRGSISEAIDRFTTVEARGEFTVVVAGAEAHATGRVSEALSELSTRRAEGEDVRTAVSQVAAKYGLRRNRAYELWLETAPK